MIHTLLATVAYLVLLGFLGILLWFVPRLDLILVVAATLLLAGYDLFVHERRRS